MERQSITQRVCDAMMPTAHMEDEQRALDPDANKRDDQGDVAEIEEVRWPVVDQIDRNQHGHEGRVGELEPQRNATHGRHSRGRLVAFTWCGLPII